MFGIIQDIFSIDFFALKKQKLNSCLVRKTMATKTTYGDKKLSRKLYMSRPEGQLLEQRWIAKT